MNATDSGDINPLPSFIRFNLGEIKIKCENEELIGSYNLLVEGYFEMMSTAQHSYFDILLNVFSAKYSVPL